MADTLSLTQQIDRVQKTLQKATKRAAQPALLGELQNYISDLSVNYQSTFSVPKEKESLSQIVNTLVGADPQKEVSGMVGDTLTNIHTLHDELAEARKNQNTHTQQWLQRSKRRMQQIAEHLGSVAEPVDPYERTQKQASLLALAELLAQHARLLRMFGENGNRQLHHMHSHAHLGSVIEAAQNGKDDLIKQRRTKQRFKHVLNEMERIMRNLAKKQHLDDIDYRDIAHLQTLKTAGDDTLIFNQKLDDYIDRKCEILIDLKTELAHQQRQKQAYQQQLALVLQDTRLNNNRYSTNDVILQSQKAMLNGSSLERCNHC